MSVSMGGRVFLLHLLVVYVYLAVLLMDTNLTTTTVVEIGGSTTNKNPHSVTHIVSYPLQS